MRGLALWLVRFRSLSPSTRLRNNSVEVSGLFSGHLRHALLAAKLIVLLSGLLEGVAQSACPSWPAWQAFKQHYVTNDGRVVDASVPEQITTSEGQSYALLFALAANDRSAFDLLLKWTENNLASGDLSKYLPAWQWGHADQWRVLDTNAASDADVWIAYSLIEAGRLWHEPRYTQLGKAVADNVLRDETALVQQLGLALLPGPRGFVNKSGWRFNASYLPIQALRLLAKEHDPLWQRIVDSSAKIISASATNGYVADWINYVHARGFVIDDKAVGSYNAIRVYLWAGMLSPRDALFNDLQRQLKPAMQQFAQRQRPAELITISTGELHGDGSPGFSAAFLPLLKTTQHSAFATQRSLANSEAQDNLHYYSDVLTLFGRGWLDEWLRFDATGALNVKWSRTCAAS